MRNWIWKKEDFSKEFWNTLWKETNNVRINRSCLHLLCSVSGIRTRRINAKEEYNYSNEVIELFAIVLVIRYVDQTIFRSNSPKGLPFSFARVHFQSGESEIGGMGEVISLLKRRQRILSVPVGQSVFRFPFRQVKGLLVERRARRGWWKLVNASA